VLKAPPHRFKVSVDLNGRAKETKVFEHAGVEGSLDKGGEEGTKAPGSPRQDGKNCNLKERKVTGGRKNSVSGNKERAGSKFGRLDKGEAIFTTSETKESP